MAGNTVRSHNGTRIPAATRLIVANCYNPFTLHNNGCINKKHLKNVGPIRHCEPPHALILHCHSPGVATVARRLRIDVHDDDDNNNNDNAWERGPLWPNGMGPINFSTAVYAMVAFCISDGANFGELDKINTVSDSGCRRQSAVGCWRRSRTASRWWSVRRRRWCSSDSAVTQVAATEMTASLSSHLSESPPGRRWLALRCRSAHLPLSLPLRRHIQPHTHTHTHTAIQAVALLSLIHIWRCRRSYACRSRWSPYH